MVALAHRREEPGARDGNASLEDVGLSLHAALGGYGVASILSLSTTDELNTVIRGRLDVCVAVYTGITILLFLTRNLEPCSRFLLNCFRVFGTRRLSQDAAFSSHFFLLSL